MVFMCNSTERKSRSSTVKRVNAKLNLAKSASAAAPPTVVHLTYLVCLFKFLLSYLCWMMTLRLPLPTVIETLTTQESPNWTRSLCSKLRPLEDLAYRLVGYFLMAELARASTIYCLWMTPRQTLGVYTNSQEQGRTRHGCLWQSRSLA